MTADGPGNNLRALKEDYIQCRAPRHESVLNLHAPVIL